MKDKNKPPIDKALAIVFRWCSENELITAALGLVYSLSLDNRLCKSNVKPIIPSLVLPVPSLLFGGKFAGLFLVIKNAGENEVNAVEYNWIMRFRKAGYKAVVTYGEFEAIRTIIFYLKELYFLEIEKAENEVGIKIKTAYDRKRVIL